MTKQKMNIMKKIPISILVVLITLLITTSCDTLNPNAPKACFDVPEDVFAGIAVTFNSSCSENATSFLWDFDDGESSTDANPSHVFQSAGSYKVELTVTNDEGNSDNTSINVTVTAPELIEHSGNIEADETWAEGVHLITGDIYVNGATLTILPGAVIKFNEGRGLYIGYSSGFSGATLIAEGTSEKPIVFTTAAATPSAGDWDYIGFYDNASGASSMAFCEVEYAGGYSSNYGNIYIVDCAVSIENSIIRHSEAHGIVAGDGGHFSSFTGNTVEDVALSAIWIYGNYVHTIGTMNNLSSSRGITIHSDQIDQANITWLKQTTPYNIDGDLYLGTETGSVLNIEAGTQIQFGEGKGMYIGYHSGTYGTLIAEGTSNDHILFSSSAPSASKSPGDWDYIGFYDGAGSSSSFAYCDFEYGGGYSSNYGMINIDGSSISMDNCTVKNSKTSGISLSNSAEFESFSNNTFEDNATYPIEIHANFAHTIGTGNVFNTGPGILVNGDDIDHQEVTWLKHPVPYIIDKDIYLGSASGSKLTFQPGTILKFTESSAIYVGYRSSTFGILIADGDPGNQITFTSAAPSGFESAGDWDGIFFYDGTSNGTIMDNCLISFAGGYSNNTGNISIQNESAGVPEISNCTITDSEAWGIYLGSNANPTLSGNVFSNNALGNMN
jgi:parallel beta-helix repeat protein